MIHQLARDIRHALRSLRQNPAYTAVVIATLAVGIGASTAIFSVVQAVLLAPLPYPEPDRIVNIAEVAAEIDIPPMWVSVPNWADYREEVDTVADLSLFRGRTMSITGGDDPIGVYGALVSESFFRVFGATPAHGRTFTAEEIGPEPPPVVVVGHDLWRRRFAGDPAIVGRTIEVDGTPRTVIGVMPPGFDAPGEWIAPTVTVELWVPFPLDLAQEDRINRSYFAAGRLRDGVTLEQAREQLDTVFARLQAAYPEANRNWDAQLLRWHDRMVGDVRAAMMLLWTAVSLVLLVACTNVASLLFARLLSRRHELAMRKALGASTPSLLRGIVSESLVLALLGGAAGVILASAGLRAMLRFEPGQLPLTHRIGIDGGVLLMALATSVATGVLFGLVPGWLATRRSVAAMVHDGGGRTVSGGRSIAWTAMVGAQVALAFVVAIGAALVGHSFVRLNAMPSGVEAERVMTATVALSWDRVTTLEDRSRFIRDVLERIEQIPGVESAAEINSLPFSGSNSWGAVWLDGQPAEDRSRQPVAAFRNVTPGYLETMGIPLLRGRWLAEGDMQDTQVAVINQAFADNYWPGVDPIGRTLAISDGEIDLRVAGIVADVRHFGLDSEARPEVYLPYTMDWLTSKTFVVRSAADPAALGPLLRDAITTVDPDQPLRDVQTMGEAIAQTTAGPRFNALMMGLAAAIALGLAALGLFGTVSYMVTQRTRELGIRLALGGSRWRVVGCVLSQGARLAAIGVLGGLALALSGGRLIQGLLFDIPATDPISFAAVTALFVLVAVVASYLPARRACRVDPVVVLSDR